MQVVVAAAHRIFTLDDQNAFARLSGDWNPLHVDPIFARRTLMGAPIVHGLHLVLWAIDRWFATSPQSATITRLQAKFPKPAYVDESVQLDLELVDKGMRCTARCSRGVVLSMSCELGAPTTVSPPAQRSWGDPVAPNVIERDAIPAAHGSFELGLDDGSARAVAPHAREGLGAGQLAELLATTRVVGMHCPGLHSIFGGVHLRAVPYTTRNVEFGVASHRLAYSMVDVWFRGPLFEGTLQTFLRPTQPRLAMSEVAAVVAAGKYAGQRALVVGGSRGIGEVFAKAIAAGGGAVCLTYNRGADDASMVVDEIHATGSSACAIQLDVLASDSTARLVAAWPLARPPTHVYYLATPTLFSIRKGTPWDVEELDRLVRYYVVGLRAAVEAAVSLGAKPLLVWTPSTTMLDRPMGGTAYCVAKAAMEELCRHLPVQFPGVWVRYPRLGRVDTDQTTSLIALPAAPALPVVIAELDRLTSL